MAEIPANSTTHELVIDLQEISLIRALFSYIVPVNDNVVC